MATIATGLFMAPRTVVAEPRVIDIAWSAPAGCPSGEEIVAATRARLGANRSAESVALSVHGDVTSVPGGFVVDLAMKDESGAPVGERRVQVKGECSAVTDATALVLAMIIGARRRGNAPARPSPDEPTPPERTEPVDPPALPAAPAPESRPPPARPGPAPVGKRTAASVRSRIVLGAAGVASRGVLPALGAGLALRATYSPVPLVAVGIEASFEIGGAVQARGAEVGFQFAGAAALAGVQVLRNARVELIFAAGARAGAIHISPAGFPVSESGLRPVAMFGPGVLARVRVGPSIFAEAFPQAELIAVRDRFQIVGPDGATPIHRPALVGARLSLGIAYEFR